MVTDNLKWQTIDNLKWQTMAFDNPNNATRKLTLLP